ncbi:UvrD-helicase domain-containing protein [Campylobacter lari]|uniref:UvrD-helicase domain-containing protein n=1 Tax=Campylobacter lari TaxID=201 RepID=UPI00144B4288|nr:UvrD-helicase domain-containing protein [Campylobacter lari]MBT0759799.1 NERD domain-containing protein [Campylobacter lari]
MRCFIVNSNYKSTDGEKFLIKYLNDNLPEDYEIYVQPNLNGNRPDIILFHEHKGVFIIEIKDWKLERFEKDSKKNKYYKYTNSGRSEIANPNSQLRRYKTQFNYFKQLPAICIHYFYNSCTQDVIDFIGERGIEIFGCDKKYNLIKFIINYPNSFIKSPNEIRDFLLPKKHKKENGEYINLTQQQKRLIEHTPKTWRRLKGVAGSGKTLVVAQKAVNIAIANKKVLIICFNRTLKRYIRDQINKTCKDFEWKFIEYNHFHEFIKLYVEENGLEVKKYGNNFDLYECALIEQVLKLQEKKSNSKNRKYDAILIDEAQDFKKEWFDILLYFLDENSEVLLAADDRQNLYNRSVSWIEESMGGYKYKFKGAWAVLKEVKRSTRLPSLIHKTNLFFETFLKDYLENHPDKNFGDFLNSEIIINENTLDLHSLVWENIEEKDLYDKILYYCRFFINEKYKLKDISILVPNKNIGHSMMCFLVKNNINIEHMFDNKDDFSLESDAVTISTINSFKGMENKVIIYISENKSSICNDFRTYVALTRAKEALVVLNNNKKYLEYSKEWM